jgi:hypothetical protein
VCSWRTWYRDRPLPAQQQCVWQGLDLQLSFLLLNYGPHLCHVPNVVLVAREVGSGRR